MHLNFVLTDQMSQIAEEYYYFVCKAYKAFSEGCMNKFIQGINHERIRLHDKLCLLWGFEKMDTKFMTDNLEKYPQFEDFLHALSELKNSKNKTKRPKEL